MADSFDDEDFSKDEMEMNRLFDMGFISLEEVESFDPKKFLAEERAEVEAARQEPVQKNMQRDAKTTQRDDKQRDEKTTQREDKNAQSQKVSKRDQSAMQSGWTISEKVKDERPVSKKVKTVQDRKESKTLKEPSKTMQESKPEQKQKPKTTPQPKTSPQSLTPPQPLLPSDLPDWRPFNLHPLLLTALRDASFSSPMPIQAQSFKCLLQDGSKHLMASAPTGSGKTLAFGLPILDFLYKQRMNSKECSDSKDTIGTVDVKDTESSTDAKDAKDAKDIELSTPSQSVPSQSTQSQSLTALIIVPTRELAIQIEKHLKGVTKYAPLRPIRLASVIGGMSAEKQDRLLHSHPDIVIATPGRLAEAMEFDASVREMITSTRFLVLDEADRMIQAGHFKELDDILAKVLATPSATRRILLFSATLAVSKDKKSPFAKLLDRLNLDRSKGVKEVAVVDLAGRPSSLHEWQCPAPSQLDKEGLILYFLQDLRKENKVYGKFGRVLMFVNAIETIRRLTPLFTLLGIPTLGLHAQMQQRQRLKNLDRFKVASECLLIASDVAARGLDIQGIEHVIHYHLPKDKETYVHRCGRTARASNTGSSLAVFAPEERGLAERCGIVGKLVRFTVDEAFIKERITPAVKLARRIESLQHTERATASQISWAQKAAEELGVELDESNDPSWRQRQQHAAQGLDEKRVKKEIEGAMASLKVLLEEIRKEF